MKKPSFQLLLISMFFYVFNISLVHAEKLTATELKILPYVEAEGELDSSDGDELLVWTAPDKVLFGTYVNSHLDDDPKYCGEINPRPDCTKPTFDRTKIFMLFDTNTKRTTFNIKNQYYVSQLASFNNHQSYTYRRCPIDKDPESKPSYSFRYARLKSDGGCLREEWTLTNKPSYFSYIRADGKIVPLDDYIDNLKIDMPFWSWIDWLGMYLLGMSNPNGHDDNSPTTVSLLSRNGKTKLIELEQTHLGSLSAYRVRPTRAGMLAVTYPTSNIPVPNENIGLTLLRKDKRYKIADGDNILTVEVSPNGCQVAYLVPRRLNEMRNGYLQDIIYSKLHVIDVCEGFGVAKDANPFANLL